MRMRTTVVVLGIGLFLVGGCASSAAMPVRHWGTMYEVLREGKTEGRVRLAEVIDPETVAVGALQELAGEVLVVNGEVWTARVFDGGLVARQEHQPGELRATLLIAARVPRWQVVAINDNVAPEQFEAFVAAAIRDKGLSHESVIPFLIEGPLASVELHVVNGRCPQSGEGTGPDAEQEPYRGKWQQARGTIVGFFAEGQAGVLTHHGSRIHAHALLVTQAPIMGHVDRIGLRPGAMLMLPIGD